MRILEPVSRATILVCISLIAVGGAAAAEYPEPKEGDWIAKDFRFHTGEMMPELRVHYTTIGAESGEPVVILHGTTGSGKSMLTPSFAGELFGPGQPLDASKYYIILPDALGHGKTAKPSDGCGQNFPNMTMTIWSRLSTGWSPKVWVYDICGSFLASPWVG